MREREREREREERGEISQNIFKNNERSTECPCMHKSLIQKN